MSIGLRIVMILNDLFLTLARYSRLMFKGNLSIMLLSIDGFNKNFVGRRNHFFQLQNITIFGQLGQNAFGIL